MQKRLPVFFAILFLWASSCNEETPVSKTSREKIIVTDLDHEPIAKDLLSKLQGKASNGRISSLEIKDAFFKYEDPDSGVLNYTFPLPDKSPEYFENMILSKYDDGFYGFIYRYIPDENYIKGESFRGTLQQFDLEENLIGEFTIPFEQDSIYAGGRTQLLNQCVQSIEQKCVTTYKVETVTDYPCHCQYDRRTQLSSVCTFSFNMGMCDDMTTAPPGGGGTYVAMGSGPSPKAGGGGSGGNTTGTIKPKTNPVVIVVPENDLYVGDKCVACIENLLKNPCLKMVAKKVLNPALASTFNNLIQDIFNKNDKVNLIIKEGSLTKDAAIGSTNPAAIENGIMSVTVTLDPTKLAQSSQERIASVIYHECFHAIVNSLSNNSYSGDEQHIVMFTNKLDLLAQALAAVYPAMSLGDAKGMILVGLIAKDGGMSPEGDKWPTPFVDKVLSYSHFTRSQIDIIFKRYETFHTSGTACD